MASEIRVDKITHTTGVGTITPSPTGVHIAGIVTGTTFSGSGASLTSLPAAQLSGTAAAINGSNITDLAAANLTGTIADARFPATLPAASATNLTNIPAANVTGTLPALTAANLTNIPAANIVGLATAGFGNASGAFSQGITEADCWRLSTTLSNNADNDITANWERNDTDFEKIGTGLSQSSGIYTFPSTGKYLLMFRGTAQGNGDKYIGIHIYVSTNGGSSYTYRGESYGSAYDGGGNTYTSYAFDTIIDVTDASNFRFKWRASSIGTCNFLGNSSAQMTGFTCIRLGGT